MISKERGARREFRTRFFCGSGGHRVKGSSTRVRLLLSIRQIGPADAIVPAEGIHIYKGPEQTHNEGSRGEIESHNAMATLTLARRFSFEGAEANLGYAHTRGGSAIDQQQVLICLLYTSPSPRDRTRSR